MAALNATYFDDVASRHIFHGAIESIADTDGAALDIPGIEPRAAVLGFVWFAARHDPTVTFVCLDEVKDSGPQRRRAL